MVSQAYSGYAEICSGFPPPQTALAITVSGRGTLGRMMQWWRVASCKHVKGRDNLYLYILQHPLARIMCRLSLSLFFSFFLFIYSFIFFLRERVREEKPVLDL